MMFDYQYPFDPYWFSEEDPFHDPRDPLWQGMEPVLGWNFWSPFPAHPINPATVSFGPELSPFPGTTNPVMPESIKLEPSVVSLTESSPEVVAVSEADQLFQDSHDPLFHEMGGLAPTPVEVPQYDVIAETQLAENEVLQPGFPGRDVVFSDEGLSATFEIQHEEPWEEVPGDELMDELEKNIESQGMDEAVGEQAQGYWPEEVFPEELPEEARSEQIYGMRSPDLNIEYRPENRYERKFPVRLWRPRRYSGFKKRGRLFRRKKDSIEGKKRPEKQIVQVRECPEKGFVLLAECETCKYFEDNTCRRMEESDQQDSE